MAKRLTSVRRKVRRSETNLGSHLLVFNDREVLQLLRTAIEREGNQGAFGRRFGIERTSLNMMVNGKRPLTAAVVKALGLRKVYTSALPWTVEELDACFVVRAQSGQKLAAKLLTKDGAEGLRFIRPLLRNTECHLSLVRLVLALPVDAGALLVPCVQQI
jgi:hypothetical protein